MTKNYMTNPAIELLADELEARGINQATLARNISISKSLISDILHHRKRISIEMALRLEKYLGISAALWLGSQQQFEIAKARKRFEAEIDEQVKSA